LHDEESEHTDARGDEELATTCTVTEEGGTEGPCQVPDLEDTVNEELDGGIGDTDSVEDGIEII